MVDLTPFRMILLHGVYYVCALAALVFANASPAGASHFRYGHYSWVQKGGNSIEVTVQNAFRRDGYGIYCVDAATLTHKSCSPPPPGFPFDGFPQVGDVVIEAIGASRLNWGDGSPTVGSPFGPLLYLVTSIDPLNNWWFGLAIDPLSLPIIDTTISHTYAAPGDYTFFTETCCRLGFVGGISEHINNPDGRYRIEAVANIGSTNSSPVTTLPPIVRCPKNGLCTFRIPAVDPNGDPLHFRLSTSAEAAGLGTFIQPGTPFAPSAAVIDPLSGLYVWDTTGASLATCGPPPCPALKTFYSTQVTIEDLTSKVAVDFLLQLVDSDPNPPLITAPLTKPPVCNTTQVVSVGNTRTFDVVALDPDQSDIVTLNVTGLPPGATMFPALPRAGNPVSSTFTWTPNASQVGLYIANFVASSSSGGFASCPTTIEVTNQPIPPQPDPNPPPVVNPDVRTQGFWKRQCESPHPSGEHANLPNYVDSVNNALTFIDVNDVVNLCDRLHPNPQQDKCEQAESQFMALLLNVASGLVSYRNCVDDPTLGATTVGDAARFIDGLLFRTSRTPEECTEAQAIADLINSNKTLVPCP